MASNIRVPDVHGGSTHVAELCHHLRRRHDVLLIARRGSSGVGTLAAGRAAAAPFKHAAALAALPTVFDAVRRFGPDIIYERCSSYGLGALLAAALRRPLLCMCLDEQRSPLSLWRADRIIATLPDLVPAAFRHKTVRVRWGVNSELFAPDVEPEPLRERLGLGAGPIVAYAGSFKSWHGLEDLVEAAALLGDSGAHYVLIGEGPERGALERRIAARGLTRAFHLPGPVPYPAVPSYLAAADICVAPYRPDRHRLGRRHGLVLDPLKVLEYLAMRKPVVTLRAPNVERLFRDGEDLLMVPPGDPGALAAALRRLYDDPALRDALGASGRLLVVERYTWRHHVEELEAIFRELVRERP